MTIQCTLRRVVLATLAGLSLGGCSSLPFASAKNADAPAQAAAPAEGAASAAEARANYRLDVQAPSALRKLLNQYLDIARFRDVHGVDAIDATELERLRRAAPAQARALLETEGYFNAKVSIDRVDEPGAATPLLRVVVEPGPRTRVAAVDIGATGALKTAVDVGDAAATTRLAALRDGWKLGVGDAFRQSDWSGAKSSALAGLRANGYVSADWSRTHAQVDAPTNSARLEVEVDSGPLYRLGPLRISGLNRYKEDTIRNVAQFGGGEPYSESRLLDFQERLQKIGLFEGAAVAIDPDIETAHAAPVLVQVRELPRQQVTVGIGYSTNTGPRIAVDHTYRQAFGLDWIAKNKFQFGPNNKQWDADLTSYPRDDLYRNFVGGSAQQLKDNDQTLTGYNLRVGRFKEESRVDRRYFFEFTHARVDSATLTTQADAISLNYHWLYRELDNVLLPTKGFTLSTQSAVGQASGSSLAAGAPLERDTGPFARLYARLTYYKPLGSSWYGTARLEAGQVFTRSGSGIPDTLLFRAGGDNSVRGYGHRELGPTVAGVTTGGRSLMTASLEFARPILAAYPEYLGAVFVDVGNAADRWADMKPEVGYGVGLRWRSPVGPLSLDLAYGQAVRQFRVHLNVGVTF
jgi:translocation and assembly module TamA